MNTVVIACNYPRTQRARSTATWNYWNGWIVCDWANTLLDANAKWIFGNPGWSVRCEAPQYEPTSLRECCHCLGICLSQEKKEKTRAERSMCLADGCVGNVMDGGERRGIRDGSLTSLVFQRCLSFGSEEHLGRHSSSFLGRYIFKCPCSSRRGGEDTHTMDHVTLE